MFEKTDYINAFWEIKPKRDVFGGISSYHHFPYKEFEGKGKAWDYVQSLDITEVRKGLNLVENFHPYIDISFVDKYILGDNVLGRAFPGNKKIQIDKNLQGEMRERVIYHEILHVLYPEWSERKVREESRTLPYQLNGYT